MTAATVIVHFSPGMAPTGQPYAAACGDTGPNFTDVFASVTCSVCVERAREVQAPASADCPSVACADCGMPYADHGLDISLPRAQWLLIAKDPEILCGLCIARRAEKLPRATVIHAVIEIAPEEVR